MERTALVKPNASVNKERDYWNVLEMSKLVTPYQSKHLPVYRWYSYKHSFSRNLVHYIIDKYNLKESDNILDPFCGAGTTLLASKERGIGAIGLDLMPLSVLATNVKLHKYSKRTIFEINQKLMSKPVEHINLKHNPSFEMLKKYFPKQNFDWILAFKYLIMEIEDGKYRDLFLLCLLSILEESSYTRKDGAFIRTIDKTHLFPAKENFQLKLKQISEDLWFINSLKETKSEAILADARATNLNPRSVTSVITSPPYPNRHDYTRIYLLELMIGFLDEYDDVKSLRYNLLRSHVEARQRFPSEDYIIPDGLKFDLAALKKESLPNENVLNLVEGYFKDMHLVLKEMYRVLKDDGSAHIVIGDARYGGVNIYAGKYIIELAKNIGFEHVETIKARDKGNSPQQMGKYGKSYSLESIVCLRK